MRVGILSDTHGNVRATTAALQVLRKQNVEQYIHCGDVGGEEIFDLLAGLPVAFVWGNTDWNRDKLRVYADALSLTCYDDMADLTVDGLRIAVTHGDQGNILKRIVVGRQHQYLLYGHTHIARDQTVDGLRWINPGAVHRSPRPTVAVLNTQTEALEFLPI